MAYISRLNPYLPVTPRPDVCDDPDLQILEVQTDLIPTFYLINLYNEKENHTKTYTIPRALTPLSLPPWSIITGDMNAHHTLWNSHTPHTTRAEELITLIEDEGWHLINAPDVPTYHYRKGTGSSVLDLTLATPSMTPEVTNWAVDEDLATGSDHEVIRFQIISLHPDADFTTAQPRLNWRKTDWEKFTTTLRNLSEAAQARWTVLRQDPTPGHLDEWATSVRDSISTAAEVSTPPLLLIPRSKRW
jgi:hypothetical protein